MAENWKSKNRRWHANVGMALAVTMGLIALSCPFIAHKGGGDIGEVLKDIHFGKFLPDHLRWIWIDSQGLGLAFLVFSGWLMHRKAVKRATNVAGEDPRSAGSSITLVGLGNREPLDAAAAWMESNGLRCYRCAVERFAGLNLEQERRMVFLAGADVDVTAAAETVLATLAAAPAGKAKRLEFTIDPTLDPVLARRLADALERCGARAAETGPVTEERATVPSAGAEIRGEMPSFAAARPLRGAAGWTLIEMMVVMAVVLIVAASLGSGMQWLARKQTARESAASFQNMVRDASDLARREMTPVRIVFVGAGEEKELESAGLVTKLSKKDHGCRLLMFEVPGRRMPLQVALDPARDEDLAPAVPVARVPRFESMTGGWLPAPRRTGWLRWRGSFAGGDLADDFASRGFDEAAALYQFQPGALWSASVAEGSDPFSVYPETYSHSPFHCMAVIESAPLDVAGSIELENGRVVDAGDLFGGQAVPHWSGRGSDLARLPSMDFLPDGGLACRDEREELRFEFGEPGADARWVVKIRTSDAETWLE